MASEKNLHHFCFWHPPLFNFNIVILLPGTKDIFLPDGLKRFLLQLASPLTAKGQVKKEPYFRFFFNPSGRKIPVVQWVSIVHKRHFKHGCQI